MGISHKFKVNSIATRSLGIGIITGLLLGILALATSQAATISVASEAETGTIAGQAASKADTNASAGTSVVFGTGPDESIPTGDIVSNGHTWSQTFADDFASDTAVGSFPGSVYSAKWSVYDEGWPDTSRNGQQCPNEVLSTTGGMLRWHLFTPVGAKPCVAVPLPNNSQTYGRYAVRFKASATPGWAMAWLLWPDSDSWNDGETDFPEGTLDSTINAFGHAVGTNPANNIFSADSGQLFTSWHTAITEWTPTSIKYYLDGTLLGTQTTDVPSVARHWVLQIDTAYGDIPTTTATADIAVDWVAIWRY
jgi:hypothetical protein